MNETESNASKSAEGTPPALAVIAAFGGIRPLANALGIAASTVEGWKERSSIPRTRHADVAAAAAAAGLALDPAVIAASDKTQAPTLEAEAVAPAGPKAPDRVATEPHGDRRAPGWLARLTPQLPAAALGAVLLAAGFLLAAGTSDLWLTRPSEQGDGAGLQALNERVASLEQATPAEPPAISTLAAALARLEQDLAALRRQVQGLPVGGDPAALDSLRTELGGRVDELAKGLADLKAAVTLLPAGAAEAAEAIEALKQQQATLEQGLLALEASNGALAGRIAALEEAQAAARETGPAALAVAAANLQDTVLSGRAYAAELAVVQGLAGEDPGYRAPLATLTAWAESGVATQASLTARFVDLAPTVARAGEAPAEEGLLEEAWQGVTDLVTIRPVGEVPGEGAGARVARAETRLAAGDLAAAVAELEGLTGAAAEAAADWLADAKARLAAADAVQRLSGLALTALGGTSGGGG